eukprot:CAMPEP_0197854014 /NCGR_PEP_ID=MMETSP1438-20131217/23880_1 /TAXON_ID=1461541 /ORGANISM="Pterosperma sp., Strain CCMP1384" /LENGTH=276 /DNA_ID=CAMNT_0043468623 /DNA_START=362 /DNA_END=1192 /DNA_ORIENTATION=+
MADSSWKKEFTKNMVHFDSIFNQWSLKTVRATALVGAIEQQAKQAKGDGAELEKRLETEWSVLAGENKKFVYGEISLITLAYCLHTYCSASNMKNFYDLGSGNGRAVIAAAMQNLNFEKLVGVELLTGMHVMAEKALTQYNHEVRPVLGEDGDDLRRRSEVSFVNGDFTDFDKSCDWSDGDVILCVSTCFPVELLAQIETIASRVLKPGSIVITITKELKGDNFELLEKFKRMQGWGPSWMFVYRMKYNLPLKEEAAKEEEEEEGPKQSGFSCPFM